MVGLRVVTRSERPGKRCVVAACWWFYDTQLLKAPAAGDLSTIPCGAFYIGPDYVTVNKNTPDRTRLHLVLSFPVRKYGYSVYSGQYTSINTALRKLEPAAIKSNSLRESFCRISIGVIFE